jgi:hypothetical protein
MSNLSPEQETELRRLLALVGNLAATVSGQDVTYVDVREAIPYLNQLRADVKAVVADAAFDSRVPPARLWREQGLRSFQSARLTASQLWAYVREALGESFPDVGRLQSENAELRRQLNDSVVREAEIRRLLTNVQSAQPYPIDPSDTRLRKLDPIQGRLFEECLICYGVGAYAGAIALCGTVAESLVERACKDRGLAPDGFGPKVRALRDQGILKHQYDDLVGLVTTYRHLAAHPSPEPFNLEKANIVIGATLILLDEVF